MRYFLQNFAKNWVVVHGTLHEKLLVLRSRQVLVVFHQMPYFLQHFAKNWVKSLVHGTLHEKFVLLRSREVLVGFSPNAILFATFC